MVKLEDFEKLNVQHKDLLIKNKVMQEKLGEMERYASDNNSLRQQLSTHQQLLDEHKALTIELRELKAKAFAAGITDKLQKGDDDDDDNERTMVVNREEVNEKIRARQDSKVLDAQIEKLLADQLKDQGLHNAVLADTQGFPLAAVGPQQHLEALAVLSGLIAALGKQSQELLPFGKLRSCELGDDLGQRLGSHFFDTDGQALALTVFGKTADASDDKLKDLARQVEDIVRKDLTDA